MSAFLWTIQCWFAVHIVLSIIGMAKGSIGEVPDTGVDRSVRALFLVCEVASAPPTPSSCSPAP